MASDKLKKQVVKELHRPARRHYKRRATIVKGIDDLWQADLAEFQQYHDVNKGYRYILVVIDCFSKYLWTRPLKDKTSVTVRKAFKNILVEGRSPKNIQTDLGKEFYNREFTSLLKQYNIHHYSTYTHMKAAMAERVIRTLKDKIYRQFSLSGKYIWFSILSEVTADYNATKHTTIKMKPRDVTPSKEANLLKTVFSRIKVAGKNKFHVGDVVRISKQKAIFEKGYTPNWSTELFKIIKIKITNPVTYLLEDLKQQPIMGAFYEEEIQKAKYEDVYLVESILRRRGTRIFVKWLGFDETHNSWIAINNVNS